MPGDPGHELIRRCCRAAWLSVGAGFICYAALEVLAALTVPDEFQAYWRVAVVVSIVLAGATAFYFLVPSRAREARTLVWTTAVAYAGIYTLMEVLLGRVLWPSPGWSSVALRLVAAALSASLVTALFNRAVSELIAQHEAEEAALRAAHEEAALRLQGVLLAARTMQHHLNNALALTAGFTELVAADPRLPEDLRQRVQMAHDGAIQAADMVRALGHVVRLEEETTAGTTILDLGRSTDDYPTITEQKQHSATTAPARDAA